METKEGGSKEGGQGASDRNGLVWVGIGMCRTVRCGYCRQNN